MLIFKEFVVNILHDSFCRTYRPGATAQRPLGTAARAKRGSVLMVNKETTFLTNLNIFGLMRK
jgi:hypothetical protein